LRDWIARFYKPVKQELGWADSQVRPERALMRHWHLVLLAYTCSLVVGAGPSSLPGTTDGGKIGAGPRHRVRGPAPPRPWARATASVGPGHRARSGSRVVWNPALRRVRAWLCPWAQLQRYWTRWSSAAPPPELAALLAHVARSLPLDAPATAPAAPT
jgi:hypothetical protein